MPKGERGTSKPFLRGKIWWIRYSVPGEEKERRESSSSRNKEDAKRLLRERLTSIDQRKITSTTATVSDLLDLYLADQRKRKRSQLKSADGYVRLHLRPAFGKIRVADFETKMVDRFIEQKQAKGFADASINRYIAALRKAFTLGNEALPPLVSTMPKFAELMLEENNVREGFLEHYQYINLRGELPEHQRIVLVIGYHFGMRRGEILSLRWDQVDWDANLIRLEKKQTKAKESRQAPLYGDVRPVLEMAFASRDPKCPFIVAWQGEGIDQVKTAWNKARERAGVPELLVHDLRRTAARNMVRAGISEKQVMLIVGWKSRAMFDRYNIIDERDLHTAGQKLDQFATLQNEKVRTKFTQSANLTGSADRVN